MLVTRPIKICFQFRSIQNSVIKRVALSSRDRDLHSLHIHPLVPEAIHPEKPTTINYQLPKSTHNGKVSIKKKK